MSPKYNITIRRTEQGSPKYNITIRRTEQDVSYIQH